MNNTSIGVQIPDIFFVTVKDKEKETCHFRRTIRGCGAFL